MSEKEYIVILHKNVDFEQFNQDMIASTGSGAIPNRSVDVANARPGSQRMTHYSLTDEEAVELKSHPSVLDVHIPPENNPKLEISLLGERAGEFKKTSGIVANELSWHISRAIFKDDPFGPGVTSFTGTYRPAATGKGVDIVIQDTGIDKDHVEFTDSDGDSRHYELNWATASGLADPSMSTGSTSSGYSTGDYWKDRTGHGTHCASIAAGKTIGWATDARIYSQRLKSFYINGTHESVAFDQIKLWHRNKPTDENGIKRPTVVSMSWGYTIYPNNSSRTNMVFRGTTTANPTLDQLSDNGMNSDTWPAYITSVVTDVEEMLAEGIHVVRAAGNDRKYQATATHQDFNNSYVDGDGDTIYTHRPGAPWGINSINVGMLGVDYDDSTNFAIKSQHGYDNNEWPATSPTNLEMKHVSSGYGPAIDIFAPGESIKGASSDDHVNGSNAYVNAGATEVTDANGGKYIKLTGTSMSTPSVAGMIACLLEQHPEYTPLEAKNWLITNSIKDQMWSMNTSETYRRVGNNSLLMFLNLYSIANSPNRIAFMPIQTAAQTTSPIIAKDVSELEMSSAIVSLYELELFTNGEPLYFHSENTEDVIKFDNGTGVKEYEAFPISMEGIELRGDGAQPRPKVRIPNVESLFLPNSKFDRTSADNLNDFQIEDLIGKRLTRRQTLSKYVQVGTGSAPTNAFQLPKATYVIDRISAKNSFVIELELASPFDLQNIKVPSRTVTGKYCPWIYKALTTDATDDEFDVKSACHWQSTRNNALLFFTIDNEPVVHTSLLGTTAYSSGTTFNQSSIAFINNQYFQSMKDNNTTTPSETDKVNWRRIRTYSHWNSTTAYTIDTSDERNNSYVFDLDENGNPTLWKALAASTGKVPRENSRFWVQADVCGKLLSSCKSRYQTTAIADTTLTNVTGTQPLGIADRGTTSTRLHGIPSASFDNNISLPFGGFPGTRRIR